MREDGTLETSSRRIPGSDVVFEICALSDPPPTREQSRLERSLQDLYPETQAAPIRLFVAWSAPGAFWTIRMASQRVAAAGFLDRTRELADRLSRAGHLVQASRYPLDSPSEGVRLPPRS